MNHQERNTVANAQQEAAQVLLRCAGHAFTRGEDDAARALRALAGDMQARANDQWRAASEEKARP